MTTITTTILIASSATILAATGVHSAVDAAKPSHRSDGKQQYSGNGMHSSGKRLGNRDYRHRRHNNSFAGRALRGVFIVGQGDSCSYSYRKWQVTGSRYWRSRYYDCRNG